MGQWNVERLSQDPRLHRHGSPGLVEGVAADELRVEGGALIFITGGEVSRAIGPGAWASVVPQAPISE
jgi:hypothetical protein